MRNHGHKQEFEQPMEEYRPEQGAAEFNQEAEQKILAFTLVLSVAAGFCDTATFLSSGQLLSYHATANLMMLAFQWAKHNSVQVWLSAISFPVFITGLITGGYILKRWVKEYYLLLTEGVILAIAALLFFIFPNAQPLIRAGFVLLIVYAMGIQHVLSRFTVGKAAGFSAVKIRNVMQAALDLGLLFYTRRSRITGPYLLRPVTILLGFGVGCLIGASVSPHKGLSSIILPAIMVLSAAYYSWRGQREDAWL